MESKKINQLATELTPALSDLTIIGDPTTGISKKITLSQMASLFTGTVEEYANLAAFPLVGVADTIYIALDTNVLYRWDTSTNAYVELSPNIINSLVFSDANGFDGNISLVGSVATLTITTALTTGSVPFIGASGALTQDNSNLFFDDTNNRLGIATASPTTPLDVFGSGIIGRLNATSTNNAYLGFASNGTNKWSAGNVQSDHRFRIFSEANSAELITILQTGEVGIGIANPTTKLHIDGAASALITNLDANVSVAKSISFRSDNSARINLEVSGTESGSNVGADFFLRTFTDAGSLLETPFQITRSTGLATFKNIAITGLTSGYLPKANGSSALSNSLIWDNGTNVGINTASPVTTNLVGSQTIVKSYNSDTPVSTTAQTYYTNQSNLYLFGRNAGLSIICPATNEEGSIFFGNSLSVAYASINTGSGTTSVGGDMNFRVGSNTTRMTLTSAGNVGIGTSSPGAKLAVQGNSGTDGFGFFMGGAGSTLGGIKLGNDGSTYGSLYFDNATNDVLLLQQYSSGSLRFGTNSAERMRITSAGYTKMSNDGTYINATGPYHEMRNTISNNEVVVLRNTSASPYGFTLQFSGASPNNSTNWIMYCEDSTAQRFSVRSNGGVYNYTGNNVPLSDQRMKKEITPLESYWDKFKSIEMVKFKYIDQTHDDFNIGVVSQQIESIMPEFVDVWDEKNIPEDGKPLMGVYMEDIHNIAMKVLQEAMTKIEEQQAQIQNLQEQINILSK